MSTEAPATPSPAAAATTAPAGGAPPAEVRTFTQDEVNKLLGERAQRAADGARSQLVGKFKELGVTSEDELASLVKSAHDAKLAQMTELQKAQERTKQLEADLARARADAESSQENVRRGRVFRENQVVPDYEEVLGFLLDKAKTDQPAGQFDERAWLESLKTQRPLLFTSAAGVAAAVAPGGAPAPIGATTGAFFSPPPAAQFPQGAGAAFDARNATPDALRAFEAQLGIRGPTQGRI